MRIGTRSRGISTRNWPLLRADLKLLANAFSLSWPIARTYPRKTSAGAASLPTGTYRLDVSRSDYPGQAAERATQSIPHGDRIRLRDEIAARLESPDQIALEVHGKEVTLASSRAPQITFAADGAERVETIRSTHGETVRVDNEGSVHDNSQTTRTAQRAAIGTAVGAIVGAVAGGGKGAAIGAIVGAGGGAGSVYVQGRDDLDLQAGTEITIRASAPR